MTTPKRPRGRSRGNLAQHSPRGHVAHQLSIWTLSGGIRHSQTHGPDDPLSCLNMLPHLDLHYQKHFLLDHAESPQTTCHSPHSAACRAKGHEWQQAIPDNDGSTITSAIMKSQKSPPTIKGDRASDTIKGPSRKEKRYTFLQRKEGRLIIRKEG